MNRFLAGARGALVLVVVASLAALLGSAVASAASGTLPGLPARSSLLFALSGTDGTLTQAKKAKRSDRYTLTLHGLDAEATWFADRPRRDAGLLGTDRLFSGWGKLGFRSDPPNAALVVKGGKGNRTMALELKLRRYDRASRSARFDVRQLGSLGGGLRHLNEALAPRLPSTFSSPSLFIDNGEFEPACTLGEIQLMAIDPAREVVGMTPADGRLMEIEQNPVLFEILRNRFGGNGETNFALPKLPSAPGTTFYLCTDGFYPQPEHLTPSCRLGETDYWVLPFAINDPSWLPADGRLLSSNQYSRYVSEYALVNLPQVNAPAGMTALTCVSPSSVSEPLLGQLSLYPKAPVEQERVSWAAATGEPASKAKSKAFEAFIQGNQGTGGNFPNLGAVGSASYFIAEGGTWPYG